MNLLKTILLCFSVSCFAQNQDSLFLQPNGALGKDAMVWNINSTTNYGSNHQGTLTAWTNGGSPSFKRFYLEFDYSLLPAGAIIDSAFLFFHHNPASPSHNAQHQGSNSYWVRRVTTSWKEDSITWLNVPQSDTLHQIQVPNFTSNIQDYEIDVTQLVADQLQYGNNGFFMRLVNESTFRAVVCASSDAADSTNHPAIKIYYTECPPPAATFNYVATGNTVVFLPTVAGTSHHWDFGNGTFSVADTPTYTFPQGGVHTVCHTVTNACASDTSCQQVQLCSPPSAAFSWVQDSTNLWTFTPSDTTGTSYSWDFGDGNSSTLQVATHAYATAGLYPVCLEITNACGSDTTCLILEVANVNVRENESSGLRVYPNPVNDVLRIEQPAGAFVRRCEVFDVHGALVLSEDNPQGQINMHALAKGTYVVKFILRNTTSIVRIVKS